MDEHDNCIKGCHLHVCRRFLRVKCFSFWFDRGILLTAYYTNWCTLQIITSSYQAKLERVPWQKARNLAVAKNSSVLLQARRILVYRMIN